MASDGVGFRGGRSMQDAHAHDGLFGIAAVLGLATRTKPLPHACGENSAWLLNARMSLPLGDWKTRKPNSGRIASR